MRSRNQVITRTSMMAAMTVVLYLLWMVPVFGAASALVMPIPLALIGYKDGPKYLFMALAGILLLLALFQGPVSILMYLPFAACSAVIGIGYHYSLGLKKILWSGGLLLAGLVYFNFYHGAALAGFDLKAEHAKLEASMQTYVETKVLQPIREEKNKASIEYEKLMQSATTGVETLDQSKEQIELLKRRENIATQLVVQLKQVMQNPLPFLAFFEFLHLLLTVYVFRFFAKRFKFGEVKAPDFSSWKCPITFSWLFLVSMLVGAWYKDQSALYIGQNLVIGFSYSMQLMYFIFGLSLVSFMVLQTGLSVRWRFVVFALSLLFANFLVIVGIVDSFFNLRNSYRKLDKKGA